MQKVNKEYAAIPPATDVNIALNDTEVNGYGDLDHLSRKDSSRLAVVRRCITKHLIILQWLPKYNKKWAVNDMIAGLTLGLTNIPESIACALLAGLPAHYGLCSVFIGSFIYLVCGSIDRVIIGPTSLVALVSVQFTLGKPIEFAVMLTFLSGIVQLIMGSLCLGFMFEFISMPVIKAFSSAAAVLVIESQIKVLLGLQYVSVDFIDSINSLLEHYSNINYGDLIMGVGTIIFLLALEWLEKLAESQKFSKLLALLCRYISLSRNTLIVLITGGISYIWLIYKEHAPYALSENTLSGLPNATWPKFSIASSDGKIWSFTQIIAELNVGLIIIPIIGILTNISIGKLAPQGLVDANHEMFTLGLCNIFGSCVQAMPVSGAFTRYAISMACGLKTPMANLYSGCIVLLALVHLSPYFNYIPKATLAAILICSIYKLFDFKLPLYLWHKSKVELLIWLVGFIVSIFCGVQIGLFASIAINLGQLLYLWAKPAITIEVEKLDGARFVCVTPRNAIFFPAINRLRAKVLQIAHRTEFKLPIVIDCTYIMNLDFTAAQGIIKLAKNLSNEINTLEMDAGLTSKFNYLILYRLPLQLQNLIDNLEDIVQCETLEALQEFLTQQTILKSHKA